MNDLKLQKLKNAGGAERVKARILPSKKERKYIEKAATMVAKKKLQEQQHGFTRRFYKLICYTLNREFGFGKGRLMKIINSINRTLTEHRDDVMFWIHLDRVVIDELGVEFEREKVTPDGVIESD